MHIRPIFSVPPAWRRLIALTETGGPDGDGGSGLHGPRPGGAGGNAASPRRAGRFARNGGATPGDGAGRGASLTEQGYVQARFGGVPVLIAPELAAQIRALREERP